MGAMLTRQGSVVWNATPLLTPLTGVGQYTLQLMKAVDQIMAREADNQRMNLFAFYGRRWSRLDDLLHPEFRGQRLSAVSEPSQGATRHWRYYLRQIPLARYWSRRRQTASFSAGCKRFEVSLYHEPNFIPLPFHGAKVVTVHDLSFIRYPETHPAERVRFMNDHIQLSVEQASRVIAVSHFVKKEIGQVFGASIAQKTVVIHNGVTSSYYPRSQDELQPLLNELGVKHRKFILSVGALEPRKNLITLIRAYTNLPLRLKQRHPLLIAGPQGWGSASLKAEMDRYRTEPIRWLGFVPDAQLPLLYSAAGVFVYLSIYEGFGLPVAEAMASGTPVITSNAQALTEVQGGAGLAVSSQDVEGVTRALESVLTDSIAAEKLAKAGLTVAKQFSWHQSALQHLQCFNELLPIY